MQERKNLHKTQVKTLLNQYSRSLRKQRMKAKQPKLSRINPCKVARINKRIKIRHSQLALKSKHRKQQKKTCLLTLVFSRNK